MAWGVKKCVFFHLLKTSGKTLFKTISSGVKTRKEFIGRVREWIEVTKSNWLGMEGKRMGPWFSAKTKKAQGAETGQSQGANTREVGQRWD